MANTYAATLAALSPDIDYKLDEASSTYANNGSSGLLPLSIVSASAELWRAAPGIIRNSPWEYAFWTDPDQEAGCISAAGAAGIPSTSTWGVGTFVACIRRLSDINNTIDWCIMGVGNSAVAGGAWSETGSACLQVDSSGVLHFTCRTTVTGALGTWGIRCSSDSAVITTGTNYHVAAVQRADGTGIHLFVNGVEVASTTSTGSSATNDDWVDNINADSVYTTTSALFLNGIPSGTTPTIGTKQDHCILQRPAFFTSALSDAQILSLFNAAAINETPRDYYEWCFENLINPNAGGYWNPGYIGGAGTDPMEGSDIAAGTVRQQTASFANLNTVETDRVTNYTNYKSRFQGATSYQQAISGGSLQSDTTGTVNIILTINELIGTAGNPWQWVFGYGEGGGGDDENVTIYMGGTVLGNSIVVTFGEQQFNLTLGTNYWRKVFLPADGAYAATETLPIFTMITLVQDGTGMKLYRDGQELTGGSTSSNGSGWDDSSWFGSAIAYTAEYVTVGYPGSASTFNLANEVTTGADIHDFMYLRNKAMTAQEVSDMWDAVQGIFPAEVTAPDGGFADTIGDTIPDSRDPADGTGPWHWWRLNDDSGVLPVDTGVAPTSGTARAEGGDPDQDVQGPLILDPTNAAVFFDGVGDYYEVGVDGAAGQLVTTAVGSVGFFVSQKDLDNDNIAYSQSNDAATAYIKFGINNGFPELYVQTSAGNSVTFTGTDQIADFDYYFIVFTNDGTNYKAYFQGVEDTDAAVVTAGTGAEGDWFDSATWTRSAIAARADSSFTTETTARFSEIFIFEDVLTASQIGALFDAATADGVAGSANANLRVVFEDVIFRNGGLADVRVINPRTDFNVALQVDRSKFLGGAQGANNAGVLVSGAVNGQVNGSSFDLQETPTTGRVAIKGTTATPATAPSTLYSLLITDNILDRMGRADAPAIFLESGFGATIKANQLFDSYGAAIGWRADAQRVNAIRNLIDGVTAGVAGLWVQNGLSTAVGRNWQIVGNTILDVLVGRGMQIEGYNSALAERARHILIARNKVINAAAEAMYVSQLRDATLSRNILEGGTQGIELTTLQGLIALYANIISGQSGEGIYLNDDTASVASLIISRQKITGNLSNDGMYIDGISTLQAFNNTLHNLANGIQLGDVTTLAKIFGNRAPDTTTPMDLIAGTTQVGLELGANQWSSVGSDILALTVAANVVNVIAPYHTITSGGAVDLNSIGGQAREGRVVTLKVATGSAIITAKDGVGDMNLAGDFAMDPDDSLTLIGDASGNWRELSRSNNA